MAGVWTNNWQAVKNTMLLGNIKQGLNTLKTVAGETVANTAATVIVRGVSPLAAYGSSVGNLLRVGTGSAAPAATDYSLSDPSAVTYLSTANEPLTYDVAAGTASKTVKLVVQNNAAASVTLREWGIWTSIQKYAGSSPTYENYVLIYRALLDTPVTLAQYETATLTLTISLTLEDPI